jgi:hypothetical protein
MPIHAPFLSLLGRCSQNEAATSSTRSYFVASLLACLLACLFGRLVAWSLTGWLQVSSQTLLSARCACCVASLLCNLLSLLGQSACLQAMYGWMTSIEDKTVDFDLMLYVECLDGSVYDTYSNSISPCVNTAGEERWMVDDLSCHTTLSTSPTDCHDIVATEHAQSALASLSASTSASTVSNQDDNMTDQSNQETPDHGNSSLCNLTVALDGPRDHILMIGAWAGQVSQLILASTRVRKGSDATTSTNVLISEQTLKLSRILSHVIQTLQELASCLSLCLTTCIKHKIALNRRKYPVELCKVSSDGKSCRRLFIWFLQHH